MPILGVCLGHQAIGAAFGGNVVRAPKLMHGKTSEVEHDGKTIFKDIPSTMTCTRYHSLIVAEDGLPDELEISARTADGETIMALRHRDAADRRRAVPSRERADSTWQADHSRIS